MDYWRKEQIGAASGVVAAVFMAVSAFVGGRYPTQNASSQTILTFLTDHRTRLLWQVWLFGAGAVAALWFIGSLRSTLRRAEGGTGRLAAVAFGAGIAILAGAFISEVLLAGLAYRIAGEVDATIAAALFHLVAITFALTCFPIALFVGSTTLVIMRTDVLPRLVAYIGVVAVGIASVGTLSMFYDSGRLAVGSNYSFYGPFTAVLVFTFVTSATLIPALTKPENVAHMRRRVSDIWTTGEGRAAER